jgi:UDP-N-acetylenolpyruvoylglucosamine reductase
VVKNRTALLATLALLRNEKIPWRVHWPMGDWLVRDDGLPGATIRLGSEFEKVELQGSHIIFGAAATWSSITAFGAQQWWTPLSTWPGTVGDLFHTGQAELLSGLLARVRWLSGRSIREVQLEPGDGPPTLSKTSILLEIELRPGLHTVSSKRQASQPRRPGTLFTEPEPDPDMQISALLAQAALTGTRLHDWHLSDSEPGTIVQLGSGTCEQLLLLTKGIRDRVEKTCGITLDLILPLHGGRRRRSPIP